MGIIREFLHVANDIYEVVRKIRNDKNIHIETWKHQLFAEKVFQKDGYLFFCILIPEAEIVKDEVQTEIPINKDKNG